MIKFMEYLLPFGSDSFVYQSAVKKIHIKIQKPMSFPVISCGCVTSQLT